MTSFLVSEPIKSVVEYPDSDGEPMADNTLQFEWIVVIKENLELLFRDRPDIFVAGDLLWYPVEGDNTIRRAPDAMVAIGRPKGYRGSYKQWVEDNIAPQVVFEVLSPSNRPTEMSQKLDFYQRYGVEEYYIYAPDRIELSGYLRQQKNLIPIESINGWTSPLLAITFELRNQQLRILRPDNQPFLTFLELDHLRLEAEVRAGNAELRAENAELRAKNAELRADNAELKANNAELRADNAELKAEQERQRAEKLISYLRSQGINADDI